MTILPHDQHLGRWQRAKARLEALFEDLGNWWADGHARLPDGWSPAQPEHGFTEVLREAEKAIQNRKANS